MDKELQWMRALALLVLGHNTRENLTLVHEFLAETGPDPKPTPVEVAEVAQEPVAVPVKVAEAEVEAKPEDTTQGTTHVPLVN